MPSTPCTLGVVLGLPSPPAGLPPSMLKCCSLKGLSACAVQWK
jgi:hypothetical protein